MGPKGALSRARTSAKSYVIGVQLKVLALVSIFGPLFHRMVAAFAWLDWVSMQRYVMKSLDLEVFINIREDVLSLKLIDGNEKSISSTHPNLAKLAQ